MVLVPPNLDDRDFQSLVDDAKRLVQQRCPEWSDHNVSDPGVTLIEAFAQMVDQLIYRLNRVPDRHYLAFLDLLGVRPFPPTAARGTTTFWLSAAQPAPVLVRAETEVATARTDTDDPITFATAGALTIVPCSFAHLATAAAGVEAVPRTDELLTDEPVQCFSEVPQVGDALLMGLSAAVPSCAVLLRLGCQVGAGAGIDPRDPPLTWEAWTGTDWSTCEVDRDETGGLNRTGDVVLHVPSGHAESLQARTRAGWLRCRVVSGSVRPYTSSPVVLSIEAMTMGGTVEIVHAETVRGEVLGTSDGAPAQRFSLARGPVVPWEEASVLEVEAGGSTASWTAVRDFSASGKDDRHYRIDRSSGTVELGPLVRRADGKPRQFGAVPVKGARLRMSAYRIGGGRIGNVARGTIRVLKTSVPYVARVENRHPALGGVDGETPDEVRLRGPLELRAGGRAVTADDFEEIAREVAPDAARVHCVPAGTGVADVGGVRLLVVPWAVSDHLGRLPYEVLSRPPESLVRRIADHLETRRLVGTRLVVEPPPYRGVTVVARLTAEPGAVHDDVRDAALAALYRHLSPLEGGRGGTGWPFGRSVHVSELSGLLAGVAGVASVDEVLAFPADPGTGQRGDQMARVELPDHALVFSFQHQVRVQ